MTNIARKIRLAQSLEFMKKEFPKDYTFFPKTYVLPRDHLAFKQCFGSKGISKSTYIIKPDGGAQGRGIFLTRKIDTIDNGTPFVAQLYIKNPLLIENKKFDLRVYVLMTSCNPLRLYLFRDGLVRICTEDFVKPNAKNLHDRCMHLTNYSINRYSEKFERSENQEDDDKNGSTGNKRSIQWLLKWLREQKGDSKVNQMWSAIGDICSKTIISILPILVREYSSTFGEEHLFKKKQAQVLGIHQTNPQERIESKRNTLQGIKDSSKETDNKTCKILVNDHFEMSEYTRENGSECKNDETDSQSDDGSPENISEEGRKNYENSKKNSQEPESLKGSRCIQVLGFDILIDDKLRPYLIEVNHLPSFETDSDLDKSIKSKVISQAMSIMKAKPNDRRKYERKKKQESEERLLSKVRQKKVDNRQGSLTSKNGSQDDKQSNQSTYASKIDNSNENKDHSIEGKPEYHHISISDQIYSIYSRHAPEKINKVSSLLIKYRSNEKWLLDQVLKKYKNQTTWKTKSEKNDGSNLVYLNDDYTGSSLIQKKTNNKDDLDIECGQKKKCIEYCQESSIQNVSSTTCSQTEIEDETTKDDEDDSASGSYESVHNDTSDSISGESDHFRTEKNSLHDIEDELLVDYDRIYPLKKTEIKQRIPDYIKMEKYIYKEDLKQQMRMTCPLHQSRSIDECDFEIDVNNGLRSENVSYSFCRSDSWINGNVYSRKLVENPLKSIPVPSTKQIEAADRLSRGFSVSVSDSLRKPSCRHEKFVTSTGKCIAISMPGIGDVDGVGPMDYFPCGAKQHIRRMSDSKKSSFLQRKSNGVLVRPVNFDFGGDFLSPFEGGLYEVPDTPHHCNTVSFLNFVSAAELHGRNFQR